MSSKLEYKKEFEKEDIDFFIDVVFGRISVNKGPSAHLQRSIFNYIVCRLEYEQKEIVTGGISGLEYFKPFIKFLKAKDKTAPVEAIDTLRIFITCLITTRLNSKKPARLIAYEKYNKAKMQFEKSINDEIFKDILDDKAYNLYNDFIKHTDTLLIEIREDQEAYDKMTDTDQKIKDEFKSKMLDLCNTYNIPAKSDFKKGIFANKICEIIQNLEAEVFRQDPNIRKLLK